MRQLELALALVLLFVGSRVAHADGVLKVDDVKVVVYGADGKKVSSKSGPLGSALLKGSLLGTGASLEVSFTPQLDGAPAKPQQAMLMGASKAYPGLAVYAVAKPQKDGSHVATLSSASIDKQVANMGGELELTLLLGDSTSPKGVSGSLGSITLPEPATGSEPQPKLLTATRPLRSNAKPNIHHTFRLPDRRAPAVVSLAFTGLAFTPLLLLAGYLASLGVNLKGLPSGSDALWVLLFHGGIAAMLLLYLLFWLHLNLAQMLPLAAGLGIFTAVTGYKALSALSARRLAEEKVAGAASKKAN